MTFLIIGTMVLLRSMSLEYETVIYACQKAFIGAFVAWLFGYMIGAVFEKSSPKKELDNISDSIDDLLGAKNNEVVDEESAK